MIGSGVEQVDFIYHGSHDLHSHERQSPTVLIMQAMLWLSLKKSDDGTDCTRGIFDFRVLLASYLRLHPVSVDTTLSNREPRGAA